MTTESDTTLVYYSIYFITILGLANAPIVETKFLELAMSLLDFSPRIPLGTFSILHSIDKINVKAFQFLTEYWTNIKCPFENIFPL